MKTFRDISQCESNLDNVLHFFGISLDYYDNFFSTLFAYNIKLTKVKKNAKINNTKDIVFK